MENEQQWEPIDVQRPKEKWRPKVVSETSDFALIEIDEPLSAEAVLLVLQELTYFGYEPVTFIGWNVVCRKPR